jgi:hypothetical protein
MLAPTKALSFSRIAKIEQKNHRALVGAKIEQENQRALVG